MPVLATRSELTRELRTNATKVTITEDTGGYKTYTVHGNLILDIDSHYDGNLVVEGSISGVNNSKFSLMVRGNLRARDINVRDIDAVNIDAGDIKARNIDALWNIKAVDINATGNIKAGEDIDAGNIKAMDINARNIRAWKIDAHNINAGDIDAYNIKAWDIDAGDIKAEDINAGNIKAKNIDAYNIKAWNIDAGNINAWFILCETLIKKEGSLLKALNLTENRSEISRTVLPRPGNREVPEKT